jgi:hypothetical protein
MVLSILALLDMKMAFVGEIIILKWILRQWEHLDWIHLVHYKA